MSPVVPGTMRSLPLQLLFLAAQAMALRPSRSLAPSMQAAATAAVRPEQLPAAAGAEDHRHSATDKMIAWLSQQPGADLSAIKAAPSKLGEGLCCIVTKAIPAGSLVFSVPCTSCFTLQDAKEDPVWAALSGVSVNAERAMTAGTCGTRFKAVLASKLLRGASPYLRSLPHSADELESHPLWWTEEAVGALRGTSGSKSVRGLRDEVQESIDAWAPALLSAMRATSAADAAVDSDADARSEALSEAEVASALRAAYTLVLSRSFRYDGMGSAALVPVLDLLQHGATPTVLHAREGDRIVVRARTDLHPGDELVNMYAAKPDFLFATTYGFAPNALGADGKLRLRQRAACCTMLSLNVDEGEPGYDLALLAHEALATSDLGGGEEEEEEADAAAWAGHLAAFAASAFLSPWHRPDPLTFGVSVAQLSEGASVGGSVGALLACARLCALTEEEVASEAAREECFEEVLLGAGRLSDANDARAVTLVLDAAKKRLAELGRGSAPADGDEASSTAALAATLRCSEATALQELIRALPELFGSA